MESKSVRLFLDWFTETAMFQLFIESRLESGPESRGMIYICFLTLFNSWPYQKNQIPEKGVLGWFVWLPNFLKEACKVKHFGTVDNNVPFN